MRTKLGNEHSVVLQLGKDNKKRYQNTWEQSSNSVSNDIGVSASHGIDTKSFEPKLDEAPMLQRANSVSSHILKRVVSNKSDDLEKDIAEENEAALKNDVGDLPVDAVSNSTFVNQIVDNRTKASQVAIVNNKSVAYESNAKEEDRSPSSTASSAPSMPDLQQPAINIREMQLPAISTDDLGPWVEPGDGSICAGADDGAITSTTSTSLSTSSQPEEWMKIFQDFGIDRWTANKPLNYGTLDALTSSASANSNTTKSNCPKRRAHPLTAHNASQIAQKEREAAERKMAAEDEMKQNRGYEGLKDNIFKELDAELDSCKGGIQLGLNNFKPKFLTGKVIDSQAEHQKKIEEHKKFTKMAQELKENDAEKENKEWAVVKHDERTMVRVADLDKKGEEDENQADPLDLGDWGDDGWSNDSDGDEKRFERAKLPIWMDSWRLLQRFVGAHTIAALNHYDKEGTIFCLKNIKKEARATQIQFAEFCQKSFPEDEDGIPPEAIVPAEQDDDYSVQLPAYEGEGSRYAIILDKILKNTPKRVIHLVDLIELTRLIDTFDIGTTSSVPTIAEDAWTVIGLIIVERIIQNHSTINGATKELEKFCRDFDIDSDKLDLLRECLRNQ